jgi:hypothetical protein
MIPPCLRHSVLPVHRPWTWSARLPSPACRRRGSRRVGCARRPVCRITIALHGRRAVTFPVTISPSVPAVSVSPSTSNSAASSGIVRDTRRPMGPNSRSQGNWSRRRAAPLPSSARLRHVCGTASASAPLGSSPRRTGRPSCSPSQQTGSLERPPGSLASRRPAVGTLTVHPRAAGFLLCSAWGRPTRRCSRRSRAVAPARRSRVGPKGSFAALLGPTVVRLQLGSGPRLRC